MDLPGQNLEKAAAETATEVGKSILRGLARLGGAFSSEWVGTKEARAQAARLAIETQAQIEQEQKLAKHRRQSEIQELNHRAALERRAERLRVELIREQVNLESITTQAIEYTQDGQPETARELNDDWMFAFAEHAQRVSDNEVQKLWARILASAATVGRPRLSAAALQTMTLLERETAISFERFYAVIASFGYYPGPVLYVEPAREIQQIDLTNLKELTLIQEFVAGKPHQFSTFSIGCRTLSNLEPLRTDCSLTKRGAEIANAIFDASVTLSSKIRQAYFRSVVEAQMSQYHGLTITPVQTLGTVLAPFRMNISHPRDVFPAKVDLALLEECLHNEAYELLAWAASRYEISLENNITPGV